MLGFRTLHRSPLFDRAKQYGNGVAIVNVKDDKPTKPGSASASPITLNSTAFTYNQLLTDATSLASEILSHYPTTHSPAREERIAFLCPTNYAYVKAQWAIWRAGAIAVPLCNAHPLPEMEYVVEDSGCSLIVGTQEYTNQISALSKKFNIPSIILSDDLPDPDPKPPTTTNDEIVDGNERRAIIIYTSGTTGRPKGVVLRIGNIINQIESLSSAWEWSSEDHIANVLPLHHIHGIVNVLLSGLWNGARVTMMDGFYNKRVWEFFKLASSSSHPLTLFMAVPTVYDKLIQDYERMNPVEQQRAAASCKTFRLMVSGSAALPESIMRKWQEISGHVLLERYGMTEIGMALSNPYRGVRLSGYVGTPLPGVKARIVRENSKQDEEEDDQLLDEQQKQQQQQSGELRIAGPNVFSEYWNKPEITAESFDEQGYFKTGDTAVQDSEGHYKILGRSSVDILKRGGYKISALELERVLLEHPEIAEVAVVGVPNVQYGQDILAIITLKKDQEITLSQSNPSSLEGLKQWMGKYLAPYKLPQDILILSEIPRNQMGKVNKKFLVQQIQKK